MLGGKDSKSGVSPRRSRSTKVLCCSVRRERPTLQAAGPSQVQEVTSPLGGDLESGCRPAEANTPATSPPTKSSRSWWRMLVSISFACLLYRTVDGFLCLQPQGMVARGVLFVNALGSVQRTVVIAAPASCLAALCTWYRLALPLSEGQVGKSVVKFIHRTMWFCLLIIAVMAASKDAAARVAIVAYTVVLLTGTIAFGDAGMAVRRLAKCWALFGPLIFEYKVLAWWARYACLSDDQRSLAFRRLHEKYAPLVFSLLADLGGVFVKLGQLLSLLPEGVLPDMFTKELKKLQNAVPPRPGPEVRRMVSDAFGRPLEHIFSFFDDTPIGSASIGQVHRARIAADNREVVVKVQYPEVSQTVELDFTTVEWVVWFLDKSRCEEIRQTKSYYIKELDFEVEARTLARIHGNLKRPFPEVHVPEPMVELCSQNILVMTFISGSSLLDSIMQMADTIAKARGQTVDQLIAEFTQGADGEQAPAEVAASSVCSGLRSKCMNLLPSIPDAAKVKLLLYALSASNTTLNLGVSVYNSSVGKLGAPPLTPLRALPAFSPTELSHAIWRVHGHQLLIDGIFSTDPHPGNIIVVGKSAGLGLIDFGQVCELRVEARVLFARLIVALAEGDDQEIARRHAQLGYRSKNMSEELLALTARMKYGDASVLRAKFFRQHRQLSTKDPVLAHKGDEGLTRAERMINVLRGTSLVLGVPYEHGPTTVWVEMARSVIENFGHLSAETAQMQDWPTKEGRFFDCLLSPLPGEDGYKRFGHDEFLDALSDTD
mmetsp:Transcript_16917/g.59097  ORF Transcript_16917/g.59097 Transcript_16917/m.59097 type:complete len:772 (+) Transcript_16917:198-2513(+)